MADRDQNLFKRLTHLFRSGPVVKKRVKTYKTKSKSSAFDVFKRAQNGVYSHAMSAYGSYDRMARYSDFSEMEYTPEIASALDIYAEEAVSQDDKGNSLHIYSENPKIKMLLEELFYDVINVDFNLAAWVRSLVKYGDFFLFNDVDPEQGVMNAYPIPVNEIEREEGFDENDPMAVRYRWVTQGNQVLENWQVTHLRLLGNDAFLPYGSSILESARRIWRQLILIEDAMLVYRVIRSPERRVFYIDVGNVPADEVPNYMEQVQTILKRSQVVNKTTGRVDLRYNPLSVDEDYFLPVRGGESGTRIDTLAGGTNTGDIDDVEYIQRKLFAALKVPKAYLGYEEALSSKATLAQEDIRFSRTITRIQKTVISELNKIAIVHLFVNGYDGDDLIDFDLKLSNPSTIAQQQKLELIRSKFDIAGAAPEGLIDRAWMRKNIMSLTDDEIEDIEQGRINDKESDLRVESVKLPEAGMEGASGEFGEEEGGEEEAAGGLFGGGEEEGGEEEGGEEEGGGLFAAQDRGDLLTLMPLQEDDDDDDDDDDIEIPDEFDLISPSDKVSDSTKKRRYNRKRRRTSGAGGIEALSMPDMSDIANPMKDAQGTMRDPYGMKSKSMFHAARPPSYESPVPEDALTEFFDEKIYQNNKMNNTVQSVLKNLRKKIGNNAFQVLTESERLEEEDEK